MHQYQPTIMETGFLFERLLIQLAFLLHELKESWIQFKKHPITFSKTIARDTEHRLRTLLSRPNLVPAALTAVAAIVCVIAIALLVDRETRRSVDDAIDVHGRSAAESDHGNSDAARRFASNGDVVQIRAVHSLPYGLTERAIAAARQIKFVPAVKGGQPVSVFMQLEYNFNLY